jgi:uncharacterized protein (DUF305 family)
MRTSTAPARRAAAGAAALVTTFALGGCASARPPQPSDVRASADSLAELESMFRDRLAAERNRHTEADVRFMADMIVHHGQAVRMSELAPSRAATPSVLTMAARIRSGQLDEIALMQRWLRERGLDAPDPDGAGVRAHEHVPGHAHHAMPGMLTDAQFAALEQAGGSEFDRLFLANMIEHHMGAVAMVDTLLAADGAAQDPTVFRLASDVKADQTAEIARMRNMLADLLGRRGTDPPR